MHDLGKGVTVVTGGAGLIGSAVIWAMNNQNSENVWLVDQWEDDSLKTRNLEHLGFRRTLGLSEFRGLIGHKDPELTDIRTIIHLGACSSTTETDENYLHDNNFLYTKELCEWSLAHGVRFIYASSAATYGDGTKGMDDKDDDIEKFEPLNLYGWSKHKFDLLAKKEGWLNRITGLKYFNVYGPNEEHKGDMRSVVSKAYEQITGTGRMTLFKSHRSEYRNGEQKRDFLYIKDAVRMTLWLAENLEATGLFNLGNGTARTWLDLGNSIFSALGQESNIEFIDMPEVLRDKYQYFTQATIAKLRSSGFADNLFSLEEAVNDYVTGYLSPDRRLGA